MIHPPMPWDFSVVCLSSPYWAKSKDEDEEVTEPTALPRQQIVPSVQNRKNALLLHPTGRDLSQLAIATVQHALLRALEAVFPLEQGEILAEPTSSP